MKKHVGLFPPFIRQQNIRFLYLTKKTSKLIFFYSSYLQTAASPSLSALAILSPSLPAPRLSLSRRLSFSQPLPNLNSLSTSHKPLPLSPLSTLSTLSLSNLDSNLELQLKTILKTHLGVASIEDSC